MIMYGKTSGGWCNSPKGHAGGQHHPDAKRGAPVTAAPPTLKHIEGTDHNAHPTCACHAAPYQPANRVLGASWRRPSYTDTPPVEPAGTIDLVASRHIATKAEMNGGPATRHRRLCTSWRRRQPIDGRSVEPVGAVNATAGSVTMNGFCSPRHHPRQTHHQSRHPRRESRRRLRSAAGAASSRARGGCGRDVVA
ncbi:hypothetical protein FS749_008231 [Ceratobasidium sp. UAMH 11750]|nr:hypothetical protein FS749_008231 [Ceratobasidium sp. UAMH 11750]